MKLAAYAFVITLALLGNGCADKNATITWCNQSSDYSQYRIDSERCLSAARAGEDLSRPGDSDLGRRWEACIRAKGYSPCSENAQAAAPIKNKTSGK